MRLPDAVMAFVLLSPDPKFIFGLYALHMSAEIFSEAQMATNSQ